MEVTRNAGGEGADHASADPSSLNSLDQFKSRLQKPELHRDPENTPVRKDEPGRLPVAAHPRAEREDPA
ncbi:unnamed protein product [Tetraodon nigroviridis]|uniref:(spotted green pufferfish) hypothetical protein n=1 Tax=Tetraodon nigroviridis TaxID=99883 RepID=Q4RNK0_TETNG|nr:unnamed protein product [Tetraodon nigroviridis]